MDGQQDEAWLGGCVNRGRGHVCDAAQHEGGRVVRGRAGYLFASSAAPASPPHRVVLAQLGPGGEGGDLPPTPQYVFLREFMEHHPMRNGDDWLAKLMAHERGQLLGAQT